MAAGTSKRLNNYDYVFGNERKAWSIITNGRNEFGVKKIIIWEENNNSVVKKVNEK